MNTTLTNHQLQPYNSFNVQARAHFFYEVTSSQNIVQLLTQDNISMHPKLVLGGGSNILFTQDFHGVVIKNNLLGIEPILEDDEHIWISVGGGENWHDVVTYCIDNHFAGIENLSLIPGSVGAAPIQNIGAYGVELSSVFESLNAINLTTGVTQSFTHADCQFGYRDSIFKNALKNQYIITQVTLRLNKQPKLMTDYGNIKNMLEQMNVKQPTIQDISKAVIAIRNQKLPNPKETPNAGSFFKNPIISHDKFSLLQQAFPDLPHFEQPNNQVKIPAAWLIEQCALKGIKKNGVGISPKHALVIVNYENPNGADIHSFSESIQKSVRDKFNIELQTEVNIY